MDTELPGIRVHCIFACVFGDADLLWSRICVESRSDAAESAARRLERATDFRQGERFVCVNFWELSIPELAY